MGKQDSDRKGSLIPEDHGEKRLMYYSLKGGGEGGDPNPHHCKDPSALFPYFSNKNVC